MEKRGNPASIHYHRRCSTKRRKCMPATSLGNTVADSYITRLKIVSQSSGDYAGASDVVEDYTHLFGRCVPQPPTTITWLSALPNHVIALILSFLPLDEAIQTSILSKRWRYLWSVMPDLSFPPIASVNFTSNFLSFFNSPHVGVLIFNILGVRGRRPTSQEIDSWLLSACARRVEHLVINPRFFYHVDRRIYEFWHDLEAPPSFSTLKRLTLSYCMFPTSVAKHLTSLEFLALEGIDLDDKTVEELTSPCPMLQELELRNCNTRTSLQVHIKNPKTSKLTICDGVIGLSPDRVLELRAPDLSQLDIVWNVARIYELKVPSLTTLKLVKLRRSFIYSNYFKAPMMKILSGLDTEELHLSSMVMHYLGTKWVTEGVNLETPIKVKRLHLQVNEISTELPGLVYFLKYCGGIETLIVDFENMFAEEDSHKHLRYLNAISSDTNDQFVKKSKENLIDLNDEAHWSSLRSYLSSQMPDLKCIIVNGFKRMLRVEKPYCDGAKVECARLVVDEYEFKLLKLLLNWSLGLERIVIATRDVYFVEEVDDKGREMLALRTDELNIHLDGEVDEMEIHPWDKVLLSLPRGSPTAKIYVNHG